MVMRNPTGLNNRSHYRAYLLFLLAAALAFNGLDGTAFGLVLQSIKKALLLTDTDLGILTGIAFSLFYSTVGVPIGRWADRGDRIAIISLTTALWGIMVMSVGATASFVELLVVRIGVAVGEAGCLPAAYSLIADYFNREERPRAVGIYLLGGCVSVIIGYPAAGWLSYHYGWRVMFVCLGAPSVVLAPLAWWTLSEPRRAKPRSEHSVVSGATSPDMLGVLLELWRNATFRCVLATQCVIIFFVRGIGVWQASFFIRSYGMKIEQLGLYFSFVYGLGSLLGNYAGGYLASRYAPSNERLQLRALAVVNVLFGALSACVYLSRDLYISLALLGLAVAGGTLHYGPMFATTQTVVPERMRATSIALIYLFSNLVGGGLGPLVVGALSDVLHPHFGAESLRYALLAVCPACLAGTWLLWQAARSVVADTEVVDGRESSTITCAQM